MAITFTEADFASQSAPPTPTNRLAFSESDFDQPSPAPVPQLNQYNPTLLERGRDLLSRARRSDSVERILGRTPEEIAANPASPDAPTTTDAGVAGLFQSKKPVVQLYDNPTTALDGLHNWAGSVVNSLASPASIATAPIAAARLPALVTKALALAFGAQGAKISYDQVKDLVENHKKNNPAQTVEDIGNLITGGLMAAGGALGLKKPKGESEQPNASSITSPTGVSSPEVRPGVAAQTPLRQQGETAGAQESPDSQRTPSAQPATPGQNAGTVKPGALPKTPDPNWQVTVQAPQNMGTVTVPGYVQIDDVTGGVNRWSRSSESLAREGLPTADLSKLPTGKYTYGQAVELAKKAPEQSAAPVAPVASTPPPAVPVAAVKPAAVSRRQDAFAKGKRGYDVIDHLQDHIGKIDPTLIKQADPDWKPTGAARQLFQKGGIPADVAQQEAVNAGMMGNVSLDDFGHGLNEAATARTGNAAARSAEEVLVQKQDAQAQRFHTDIRKPTDDTHPLLTEDLNEGDEFQLKGKKLKVTKLDYDEDGRVTFLELDDGNRYGTQVFHGDTELRKDSGVPIKRAAKPVEAAPVAATSPKAELPKLAVNEKGTGDLLKNQTEDLKLVGEQGADLERAEAEKAQARADKQAAADFAAKNQPSFVGMGAAVPSEFGQSGGGFSIKNQWMDTARAKLGLGSAVKVLRETWSQALDRAEATINRDPAAPEELVEELKKKPRSLDPWEKAMIGWYWIQNKTEFDNLSRDATQAYDDGRLDDLAERKAQLQVFGDKLLDIANVADRTGTIEGRALNARKMFIDDDFTLGSLETQKRAERGGAPVTDEERKQLQKIADDYQKANDELKKHLATAKDQLSKAQADLELARLQKAKPAKPRKGDPSLEEKIAGKADAIRQKASAGKLGDITNDVQALARLFVQAGVRDREQLIDAVHGVLTQIVPEMTRRDTMDAISGYGSFKQLSKDEISTALRGMKGEMQQVSKLEDMAEGVPPLKTGIERRTPTDEERRLIKAVNESKVKFQVPITDPARQLKSALDTRKTQLENQIKDYEAKIRDGDFSKRSRRELTLDRRAQELLAQKNRIAKKWKEGVLRDRLANRKGLEKAFDWVTNIRRFEVLSGFRTMAKLAAYSATKVPTMLATEAIGRGLSKLPYLRQIAAKAPSESGATVGQSARALAKGLTNGFSDAYKTLTTGESDLKAAYNTRPQEPRQWWQFYQILHEAIKSPLRRTAFELSLAKRVEHAALNGADVTDPLVRIALGTDAYIDSDRALLLENNRLSSAIRSGFKQLERPDKKTGRVPFAGKAGATVGRVQFPILTVPLNYAKQEIGSAFGLLSGSAKARLAFKEGIDKLDPNEADQILRHLKYGTIGGALLLYGFYDGWKHGANGMFGGYYLPGEKKKPTQAGVGGVRVAGHNISGLFLHNPLLAVGQLGHTIGAVAHSKFSKNDHDNKGIVVGTVAGLMGLINDSPLGQNATYLSQLGTPREIPYAVGEQLKGLVAPQMVQEIATYTDRDANGNLITRKPRTITEHVMSGIPGLRQNVPAAPRAFNFNQ